MSSKAKRIAKAIRVLQSIELWSEDNGMHIEHPTVVAHHKRRFARFAPDIQRAALTFYRMEKSK